MQWFIELFYFPECAFEFYYLYSCICLLPKFVLSYSLWLGEVEAPTQVQDEVLIPAVMLFQLLPQAEKVQMKCKVCLCLCSPVSS